MDKQQDTYKTPTGLNMSEDKQQAARDFDTFLIEEMGPHVLAGDTMSMHDAMQKAWQASRSALMPALVEARDELERAKWGITSCAMLIGRESIHEDPDAIDELLHYVNQIEAHQIPAIERIDQTLARINAIIGDKK